MTDKRTLLGVNCQGVAKLDLGRDLGNGLNVTIVEGRMDVGM